MRRKWIKLLAAALALVLLFGCQATPEEEIVVQKDLEQMIEKAQATPEASEGTLRERLGAPAHFTVDAAVNAPGTFTVITDADVFVPDVMRIATARVDKHTFTQQEAAHMVGVLFGGQATYSGDVLLSKQYYQDMILELQRQLAVETDQEKQQQMQQSIDKFLSAINSLPEGEGRVEVAPEFTGQNGVQRMYLVSDCTDGCYRTFSVSNNDTLNVYEMSYLCGQHGYVDHIPNFYNEQVAFELVHGREAGGMPEALSEPEITVEQAQQTADGIASQLGMGEFACVQSALVFGEFDGQWIKAYTLEYTRRFEGAPFTYINADASGATDDGLGGFIEGWAYERLRIIVGDNGVLSVTLTNPYEITEVVTEDTTLLPFDDVMDTYRQMIVVTNEYTDTKVELCIDRIALGLARITDSATRETGVVVPVWDFFGTKTMDMGGGGEVHNDPAYSYLTINAIDGTVIDRNQGY